MRTCVAYDIEFLSWEGYKLLVAAVLTEFRRGINM